MRKVTTPVPVEGDVAGDHRHDRGADRDHREGQVDNRPITSRHSARPDNKRAETSFSRT
jgi:hypothetical protein